MTVRTKFYTREHTSLLLSSIVTTGGIPVGDIHVPVGGVLVRGAPVEGVLIGDAPVGGVLVRGAPVEGVLVGDALVGGVQVRGAPVEGVLVRGAPVEGVLVGGTMLIMLKS